VREDGSPVRTYTWGPSGISSIREGGESYTLLSGARGEIIGATDSSGAIVSRTAYTAYGEIKETSGVNLPLTFSGRFGCYSDSELTLCGQRWYAPKLTRWLSRDPIGYHGGVNLFGFVEQDPINYVDITGASPVDAVAGFLDDQSGGALEWGLKELGYDPYIERDEYYDYGKDASELLDNVLFFKGLVKKSCKNVLRRMAQDKDKFRRTPKNLKEKLTLEEAMTGEGREIMPKKKLGDPRFQGMQKFSHYRTFSDGTIAEVHFVKDPATGKTIDFKFKD
jgi:RHS repeat-associated protein